MAQSRDKSIGAEFHSLTKYRRGQIPGAGGRAAPAFKVYANPREVAALPVPKLKGGAGLWEAFSTRNDGVAEGGRIKQAQLSQLLWAAAGFTFERGRTHLYAKAASSIETYVVARQVQDLFPGVYHYNPREHSLAHLSSADPTDALADALVVDLELGPQALAICLTGIPGRHPAGSDGRSFRYLYLDAGAMAQAFALGCVALGLASSYTADFYDDELAELLQVDGRTEVPLAVLTVGC